MPELPEVECFRRFAEAHAVGRAITAVDAAASPLLRDISARDLSRRLSGERFGAAVRHGKHLFLPLQANGVLALHFGMTGSLVPLNGGDHPSPHCQLLIRFDDDTAIAVLSQRKLGEIALDQDVPSYLERAHLGPDALDREIDAARLSRMLRGRRGSVKAALMNQELLAGIGNVYSDEILFQAGIHPLAEAGRLGRSQLSPLHRSLRHVLDLAIAREADPTALPESWLLRNRRKGGTCPRCGTPLERRSISGRTTYWCPRRQGSSPQD